ncbi:MAG: glycosyltransferase [Puniceicoccales bacterium]|jgi:glycosyltransferase involved in cell wall biosynthesis|nr:glycosyltransferase [Puniceicoccales bacterium]
MDAGEGIGEALPIVSIILPVYAVEAFLPDCLDSICDQSFSNFECICVNDGSPDGCGEILDAMAKRDGRFRVLHRENGGVGAARNAGMEVARGQWIAFADPDDLLHRDYLQILHRNLLSANADVSLCGYVKFSGSRRPNLCRPPGRERSASLEEPERFRLLQRSRSISLGTVWGKLFCRKILAGLSFSDLCFREDLLFTTAALLATERQVLSDARLYFYRDHARSICNRQSYASYFGESVRCAEKIKALVAGRTLPEEVSRSVERRMATLFFQAFVGGWRRPGFWKGHRRLRRLARDLVKKGDLRPRLLSPGRRLRLWLYQKGVL